MRASISRADGARVIATHSSQLGVDDVVCDQLLTEELNKNWQSSSRDSVDE